MARSLADRHEEEPLVVMTACCGGAASRSSTDVEEAEVDCPTLTNTSSSMRSSIEAAMRRVMGPVRGRSTNLEHTYISHQAISFLVYCIY